MLDHNSAVQRTIQNLEFAATSAKHTGNELLMYLISVAELEAKQMRERDAEAAKKAG